MIAHLSTVDSGWHEGLNTTAARNVTQGNNISPIIKTTPHLYLLVQTPRKTARSLKPYERIRAGSLEGCCGLFYFGGI